MAKKHPKRAESNAPNPKLAPLPRRVDYTPEFKKSWERYNKAGRHDMNVMREVM